MMDVIFDNSPSTALGAGRAVGVRLKDREVRAQVVVDASGQNGLIANRLGLRVWDPILNKGAIWTYFEGAYRDTGRDEGATMVLQTPDKRGWFWYIPQHDGIVSVGVVGPFDHLFIRNIDVVAGLFLGRRRKNRLRQLIALPQPGRKANAADGLRLLIFLPPRAGQVSTGDAFDRHHLRLFHQH